MFKKLTKRDGQPVWINLNQVMHVQKSSSGGARITFALGTVQEGAETLPADVVVDEPPEQIFRKS